MPKVNIALSNNRKISEINLVEVPKQYIIKIKTYKMLHLNDLYHKGIITKEIKEIAKKALENWCLHASHPSVQVKLFNANNNTSTYLYYNITRQPTDVVVVPNIVESYFGIKSQSYPTIKVTDSLYLTSHNFITEVKKNDLDEFLVDLDVKPLSYDIKNLHYSREDGEPLKNVTAFDINLIHEAVKKNLMNSEAVKVDITSHIYTEDALLASKILESGDFDFFNTQKFNSTVELFDSKIKFDQDLKQKAFYLINAKINNKGETKALMLVKKPDSDEL